MSTAEVRAKLSMEGSEFRSGLEDASGAVDKFAGQQISKVKGALAGAFSVGAIIAFGKSVVDLASQVDESSKIIGISTDSFQALSAAAQQNDSSMEDVRAALIRLRDQQGEVIKGNAGVTEAFGRLGISATDVARLNVDQLFALIGQKSNEATDSTTAFNAVVDILGRDTGAQLQETLKSIGEDGLQTVIDKGKEAGSVIDREMIQKMAALQPALDAASLKLKVFFAEAAVGFVEFMNKTGNFIGGFIGTEGGLGARFNGGVQMMDEMASERAQAARKAAADAEAEAANKGNERVKALEANAAAAAKAEVATTKQKVDEIVKLEEQRAKIIDQMNQELVRRNVEATAKELDAYREKLAAVENLLADAESRGKRGGGAFSDAARAERQAEREKERNERARDRAIESAQEDLDRRMKRGQSREEALAQMSDAARKALEFKDQRALVDEAGKRLEGAKQAAAKDPVADAQAEIARLSDLLDGGASIPVRGIPADGIPVRMPTQSQMEVAVKMPEYIAVLKSIDGKLDALQWVGKYL